MDKKTRTREFGNLMEIKDNYPKYVVTLNDMIAGEDYKGWVYQKAAKCCHCGLDPQSLENYALIISRLRVKPAMTVLLNVTFDTPSA